MLLCAATVTLNRDGVDAFLAAADAAIEEWSGISSDAARWTPGVGEDTDTGDDTRHLPRMLSVECDGNGNGDRAGWLEVSTSVGVETHTTQRWRVE